MCDYLSRIMQAMFFSPEVCLLAFIFVHRLKERSKVTLLKSNWRPIFYAAILLAGKYYEDHYFWNVDFARRTQLFSLAHTSRLEDMMFRLCGYALYTSEAEYDKWFQRILN